MVSSDDEFDPSASLEGSGCENPFGSSLAISTFAIFLSTLEECELAGGGDLEDCPLLLDELVSLLSLVSGVLGVVGCSLFRDSS